MAERRSGLLLEFETGAAAVAAARHLRESGYQRLDIHAAYELPGASEALGLRRPRHLPRLVLLFGLLGAATGYLVQWYTNSFDYPIVVGGRPIHPIPAFVPITFESGVLLGSFAALFGLLAGGRLMRLWQAIFEVPGFERATIDRYFVSIQGDDPKLDGERTREEAKALGALRVEALGAEP